MIVPLPKQRIGCMARVTFLNENGERIPAITQDGKEFWGGEWQANMLTDEGLDMLATVGARLEINSNVTGNADIRRYLRLSTAGGEIKDKSGSIEASQSGNTVTATDSFFSANDVGRAVVFADGRSGRITSFTSSTEVQVDTSQSVAQQVFERWHVEITQLGAPLYPSQNSEGFDIDHDWERKDGDLIGYSYRTRVCTLGTDENLTGYTFSPTNTGLSAIAEKFRDATGNPITLSLTSGKKVRVDHCLIVAIAEGPHALTLNIDEYDAADQLVATHSIPGQAFIYMLSTTGVTRVLRIIEGVLFPSPGLHQSVVQLGGSTQRLPVDVNSTIPGGANSGTYRGDGRAAGSYANGSRRQTKVGTASASRLNDTLKTLFLGDYGNNTPTSSSAVGFAFVFDAPYEFTKENTHTLQFGTDIRWDRDYTLEL